MHFDCYLHLLYNERGYCTQGFRQVYANFKRKDKVQMIPIVIMAIEDESDRDYITGLFLKNERSMYAMALKIVKEHHTACDMPEND